VVAAAGWAEVQRFAWRGRFAAWQRLGVWKYRFSLTSETQAPITKAPDAGVVLMKRRLAASRRESTMGQ